MSRDQLLQNHFQNESESKGISATPKSQTDTELLKAILEEIQKQTKLLEALLQKK